jgi:DNA integrity scanning protein DisA with diadenylate cyclase activity
VLLKKEKAIGDIVLSGDRMEGAGRAGIHRAFDTTLGDLDISSTSRRITVELAGLDGAVVLNNRGGIRAYGAVLNPKRRGKITPAEGSRTKAAIGASNYGLAVKISSDGDISFYADGKRYLVI